MKILGHIFLLLFAGSLSAPSPAAPAPAVAPVAPSASTNAYDLKPDTLADQLHLNSGDKLLFSIAEDPQPGPAQVLMVSAIRRLIIPVSRDSSQTIAVSVANKTLGQIKAEIAKALNADYYFNVHFQLTLESTSPRQGEVLFNGDGVQRHQLEIDPTDPPHIYEACLKVGLTEDANRKRVMINRIDPQTQKQKYLKVNLIEAEKDRSKDPQLQDGDRVTINTKWLNFH